MAEKRSERRVLLCGDPRDPVTLDLVHVARRGREVLPRLFRWQVLDASTTVQPRRARVLAIQDASAGDDPYELPQVVGAAPLVQRARLPERERVHVRQLSLEENIALGMLYSFGALSGDVRFNALAGIHVDLLHIFQQ